MQDSVRFCARGATVWALRRRRRRRSALAGRRSTTCRCATWPGRAGTGGRPVPDAPPRPSTSVSRPPTAAAVNATDRHRRNHDQSKFFAVGPFDYRIRIRMIETRFEFTPQIVNTSRRKWKWIRAGFAESESGFGWSNTSHEWCSNSTASICYALSPR